MFYLSKSMLLECQRVPEESLEVENEVKNQQKIEKNRRTTKTNKNQKNRFCQNVPSQFGPNIVQNWSEREIEVEVKRGEIVSI